MNFKALAVSGIVVGAASAELINLYKQVMGRNDRKEMLATKFAMKSGSEDQKILDDFRKKCQQWVDTQNLETCAITSNRGDVLHGYFLASEKPSDVIVVGSHGFHADHTKDPYTFIRYYHEKGYNFFCCDHVGHSASSGEYIGFDYYESEDLLSWIDYLIARFGKDKKIILHGVSMGAATVLKTADRVPDCVKLIISDCSYTSAKDEFMYVARNAGVVEPKPIYNLMNTINKKMAGFDLNETDVRENVKNTKVPILFIHGGKDDFVPTRMVYELYNLCPIGKKDMKIFDNAKHAQSCSLNDDEYYKTIDKFIEKRLK